MDIKRLMLEKNSSGLGNIGSTCYVNTAIQCLGYCHDFLELILTKKNIACKSTPLMNELQDVYRELWVNGNAIAPYKFMRALQSALGSLINVVEQNDICEFLTLYLDKLNADMSVEVIVDDDTLQELKRKADIFQNEKFANLVYSMDVAWLNTTRKEYSPIIDLFYGQQVSQIICGNCKYIHHNYEVYSSLCVPIPSNTENNEQTIYNAFDIMFKNEHLNADDKEWTCDKCNAHVKSLKCTRLWKLPKILIVTIKRFDHTLKKNVKPVKVPDKLSMKKYKIYKDTYEEYKLTSICLHQGSANYGHYVALCRHPTNNWVVIDDQSIRKATDDQVNHAKDNGYVYIFEALGTCNT
jgi:ubiquitin carboxyl-terminal hydrolase 8